MPLTVIGNASNLIVRDGGIEGLTMILTQMNGIQVEGNRVVLRLGPHTLKQPRQLAIIRLLALSLLLAFPAALAAQFL